MLLLQCLVWLFCACCLSLANAWSEPPYAIENAELHFEQFIQKYNKQYVNEHEKQARLQIFKDNLEIVNNKNKEHGDFIFGITQFMDLTLEEFRNGYTGLLNTGISDYHNDCTYLTDANIDFFQAPDEYDWRELNFVTRVKDQKKCRSSYAFSAIANIESQYAIKYNKQIDLSEQQIVDCYDWRKKGCGGGIVSSAFRSLIQEGGCMNETDYPYVDDQEKCKLMLSKIKVVVTDCNYYNFTSQETLKQELFHNGPISVAIKSDGIKDLHNKTIVPDSACSEGDVNHAVLLVGYGQEGDKLFWIVKNSWGTDWGDKGFFRIQRGENAESCGLMNDFMSSVIIS